MESVDNEEQGLYKFAKAYEAINLAQNDDDRLHDFDVYKQDLKKRILQDMNEDLAQTLAKDGRLRNDFNSNSANPNLVSKDGSAYEFYNQHVVSSMVETAGLDEISPEEIKGVTHLTKYLDTKDLVDAGDLVETIYDSNPEIATEIDNGLPEIQKVVDRRAQQQEDQRKQKDVGVAHADVHDNTMSGKNVGLSINEMRPIVYTNKYNEVKTGVLIDPIKRGDLPDQHTKYDGAHVVNRNVNGKTYHNQMINLDTTNHILMMHGQHPVTVSQLQDKAEAKETFTNEGRPFAINANIFHPKGKEFGNYVINPNPDKIQLGIPVDEAVNKQAQARYEAEHAKHKDEGKDHQDDRGLDK